MRSVNSVQLNRFSAGGIAFALCTLVILSTTGFHSAATSTASRRTVTLPKGVGAVVSIGKPTIPAPANYIGVSMELSGLCQFMAMDAEYQTEFENLLRNLGPLVLKVGGKSSDYSTWSSSPTASPVCAGRKPVATQTEVNSFFNFATRTGVQVIWGLPLVTFNTKLDAREAAYVAEVGHANLLAFTIGNEPDLYTASGIRPAKWTFAQYWSQWSAVRNAVVKAVPTVPVVGPEQCCNGTFFKNFALKARGAVGALSYHIYAGSRTSLTASYLMSPPALGKETSREAGYWRTDAKGPKVPLWITEANTFPEGGVAGVSNAYVSALWLADFLFASATFNTSQVDVQQAGESAVYNPFTPTGWVRPIFYGMLLYHSIVPAGSSLLATSVTQSASTNVTAYANRSPSGGLDVILFNKGVSAKTVDLTVDKAYASAGYYRLQAPSLASTAGITLGGHALSPQGLLAPPTLSPLKATKLKAALKLPAGSATCIVLTPVAGQ